MCSPLIRKTGWSHISGLTQSSERRPHQKNFFKLMNNTVFGKTMENLRNRTNMVLVRVNEQKKLRELLSHPLHDRYSVFGKSLALVGIQMHKDHILMNRLIYTGMTVLELSCCMISTTTIWSPSMAQNASSSTQTLTLSYLRSRQMTSTKTWERTWITMTQVTFQRTIHCTAKKTRRFWKNERRVRGRPYLGGGVLAL